MANPLAAHTFDQFRIYLSERDLAAPGAGTWGANSIIFDANLETPEFGAVGSFSAGALSATAPRGIVCRTGVGTDTDMIYLGDGLPDTPIVVDVTVGAFEELKRPDYWDTSHGVWIFGSNLFLAGWLDSGTPAFWLIKSSDGGSSWTHLTDANAPPGDGIIGAIQRVNDIVYFFMPSDSLGTGNFALYAFDLATETWAAPTAALPTAGIFEFAISGSGQWSNGLVIYPDGDVGIFYVKSGGAATYREWNGASWGAEVSLPGDSCANMIIDPSQESIHVFTYDGFDKDDAVIYSIVAHGGAVTPSIDTIPASVDSSDGVGHCSIQDDLIFVPRDDYADGANAVWVANLSDGQFQKELLPVPADEQDFIQSLTISAAGSGYAVNDTVIIDGYVGTNPTYGRVDAVNGSGGVTSFAFGAAIGAPPGGGYSAGIVSTSPGWTNPGAGIGLTLNITSIQANKNPSCAYMMFPNGFTDAAELTLACPVDGGTGVIGVPYSAFLVATGGVEPYTFSIISGSLPPGLSLNPSTGEISGTPTTPGSYSYEAQVEDAEENTATTEGDCTIEIPSNLSVACPVGGATAQPGVPYDSGIPIVTGFYVEPLTFTIIAGALPDGFTLDESTGRITGTTLEVGTFDYTLEVTDSSSPPLSAEVPAPCPIVVTSDIAGHRLKLMKVIATLKPATHLPVRGSVT